MISRFLSRLFTRSAGHTNDRPLVIVRVLLGLLVVLVVIVVIPGTDSVVESTKHLLLVWVVAGAALLYFGRMLLRRRFSWVGAGLGWPLVGLAVAAGITTLAAVNWRVSVFGAPGYRSDSLLATLGFIVLAILIVSVFRERRSRESLTAVFFVTMGVAVSASIVQVLWQSFGGAVEQLNIFNLVASSNAIYGVLLAVAFVAGLPYVYTLRRRWIRRVCIAELAGIFVLLGIIDSFPAWAVLILGLFVLVTILTLSSWSVHPAQLAIPLALLAVSVLLLFVDLRSINPIVVPLDTTLGHGLTWDVTRDTLRADPLTGTGPNGFSYAYTEHRPTAVNTTAVWNLRFLKGSSQWLQIAATGGLLLLLAYGWIVVRAIRRGIHALRQPAQGSERFWYAGVFAAWIGLTAGGFFYTYGTATLVVFWFLLVFVALGGSTLRAESIERPRGVRIAFFLAVFVVLVSIGGVVMVSRQYAAEAFANRARSLVTQTADLQDVQRQYLRAVNADPHYPDYAISLAQSMVVDAQLALQQGTAQPGAIEEAITNASALVNAAVERDPHNPRVYELKADFFAAIQAFATDTLPVVVSTLEEAVERSPRNPVPLYVLGNAYLSLANSADMPDDERTRSLNESRMRFEEALALKPEYLAAVLGLGTAQESLENHEAAESAYRAAVALAPSLTDTNLALARYYHTNGRVEEAEQFYRRVRDIDPAVVEATYGLAEIAESAGDVESARSLYEDILERNPDDASAQERINALNGASAEALPE